MKLMRKRVRGTPETATLWEPVEVVPGSARRLRLWRAAAVVVLGAGMLGAVFTADVVARNGVDQSRRAFVTTSAGIASMLELDIQHEEDLSVSVGAFVAGKPDASNADFTHWLNSLRAFERYAELEGVGFSIIVPAAQLAAFATRAATDPVGPLSADGTFQVLPPGDRPYYCLAALGRPRDARLAFPAGYDFCAANPSLSSRDSGLGDYTPLELGSGTLLAVEIPIYSNGVVPTSVTARREAFLGWVGMVVAPGVVLARAMQDHPGMAVTFRYHDASSDVTFHSGTPPAQAQSHATDLRNGWSVTTFGEADPAGVFANRIALELLLGGIALSVLLATLIYVLATGRARALALVSEKTHQLRYQALHDVLTGLPNRALITDRIEQMLARNRREGTAGAALFVDLDGFKNVNDTLGHEAGDQLLQAVAARIRHNLRDVDTVGRMGGDEFVVLMDGGPNHTGPELVATRLLELMREPFELDLAPRPMTVTASVGVAIGDRAVPGDLLRDADVALYQAKAAGRDCYEVFHQDMEASAKHRYEIEFDLRAALEGHQFRLVYQPIYDLHDLTLTGVEALIRWQHPTLGEIQPSSFIPLLESSGQIIDVGRWVLREACTQAAAWRARGNELFVSVNVSGRQLDRDVIVEHVHEALDISGLAPSALTIEVTETAVMRNVDSTARRLREVKAVGVQVAIDDFGTGYSSLAYLQRLPVDCLKIDRMFIDAVGRSPESDALIHTFVQLGKDLGMTTLAEGVEDIAQIDHLRNEGVDTVQGFLLSRPLTPEALDAQFLGTVVPR
jgi:diguanylate cyclase (GGDEF)-like protein